MVPILIQVVLAVHSLAAPKLLEPGGLVSPASECLAENESSRRIVTHFVSDDGERAVFVRERTHVQRVPANDIHLLADSTDAETCRRLRAGIDRHVQRQIGHAVRSHPIFYRGGPYYFAVFPLTPHTASPPGMMHIDTRWSSMFVLDGDFNVITVIAV